MENNKQELSVGLDSFLDKQKEAETTKEDKVEFITTKTGIVERIDKTLVTEDGRVLLLEQLFENNVL